MRRSHQYSLGDCIVLACTKESIDSSYLLRHGMRALNVIDLHGVSDGSLVEFFGFRPLNVLNAHVVSDEFALR